MKYLNDAVTTSDKLFDDMRKDLAKIGNVENRVDKLHEINIAQYMVKTTERFAYESIDNPVKAMKTMLDRAYLMEVETLN